MAEASYDADGTPCGSIDVESPPAISGALGRRGTGDVPAVASIPPWPRSEPGRGPALTDREAPAGLRSDPGATSVASSGISAPDRRRAQHQQITRAMQFVAAIQAEASGRTRRSRRARTARSSTRSSRTLPPPSARGPSAARPREAKRLIVLINHGSWPRGTAQTRTRSALRRARLRPTVTSVRSPACSVISRDAKRSCSC